MTEQQYRAMLEDLLAIQGRIIVLESLYTKFPNLTGKPEAVIVIETDVREMLRDERRKLVSALNDWIGRLS